MAFYELYGVDACSTVLCRLVKGEHTPSNSNNKNEAHNKSGIRIFGMERVSRAISARGMTGFFAGAFSLLLHLVWSLYVVSFSWVPETSPSQSISRHMETMMKTENVCARRRKNFHVCLCPIKCAAFYFFPPRRDIRTRTSVIESSSTKAFYHRLTT